MTRSKRDMCGGVLFAGKWRNMGLSRTCKRCRCCPKREACDLKRMESLGYLDPSTLTFPVEIHVNVDTGADISKISEDISKVLGKVVLHGD